MKRGAGWIWFWLTLLLLTACGNELEVVAEDRDALVRFEELECKEIRRGPDLGIRLRTRLKGYGQGSPPCVLRCTVHNKKGEAMMNPTLLKTGGEPDSLQGPGDSMFVTAPSVVFGRVPQGKVDPVTEVFIPYHYFHLGSGDQRIELELELLEGRNRQFHDLPKMIAASKDYPRVAYQRIGYEFYYPDLHSIRLWVRSFSLDTTRFDPHSADEFIIPIRPEYGFPDLCWTVGVDYEIVYQSDFYQNSLDGHWSWPSEPFYVAGQAEEVRLCVMDWDDDRFIPNLDDALACWEGRLLGLSSDPAEPSRLNFGMVRNMEVVVLWDGALPSEGS